MNGFLFYTLALETIRDGIYVHAPAWDFLPWWDYYLMLLSSAFAVLWFMMSTVNTSSTPDSSLYK